MPTMQTFSPQQAIRAIRRGECFHAIIDDTLELKIERYTPLVCTAIHSGHRLRPELEKRCLLSQAERYFEEDPFTDEMILTFPITLKALDSRFEYDLNRAKSLSTYFKSAWEKQVWKTPLSDKQRQLSHQHHELFYTIYETLVEKLESEFRHVLVIDLHSYNYQRHERPTPVFNIGSKQVDNERWGRVVERFRRALDGIELPNVEVDAKVNDIFQGLGYLIAHTNAHFDRTLVLPTEVKKVFMDETNGEPYPLVLEALKVGFKEAVSSTAAYFDRNYNQQRTSQGGDMLTTRIEPALLKLDKQLWSLANGVDTLRYVNPLNLHSEYRRFTRNRRQFEPRFTYRQLDLDPFRFRESLYRLPIEPVSDAGLSQLYQQMVDKLANKIDLLSSVGTPEFQFNSLRYYGRPSLEDVKNAEFLLHSWSDEPEPANLTASEARDVLVDHARQWGLKCKVSLSSQIAARAMMDSVKRTVVVNRDAAFSESELRALSMHEVGVHLFTTLSGGKQPLKVMRMGLPDDTETQEGLAILAEYCGGAMSINRLKELATRVVAVHQMLQGEPFYRCYEMMSEQYGLEERTAFRLCARVYRGGGFSKDHLYLRGFIKLYQAMDQGQNLAPLLTGKASLRYLPLLEELIQRQILEPPEPVVSLTAPAEPEPILAYLVKSITQ